MTPHEDPARPSSRPPWIYKRDGRLVPFDADRISRSLFAATESLGRPDAFKARELTDGVLHFLSEELDGPMPTTGHIRELVVKVVRELGQPALAQAFARHVAKKPAPLPSSGPSGTTGAPAHSPLSEIGRWIGEGLAPARLALESGRAALREYSLSSIFRRDLVSAHHDGLLTLTGLEAPLAWEGIVASHPASDRRSFAESLEETCRWTGNAVALDGPEFALASIDSATDETIEVYLRDLTLVLRLTGLSGILNLNVAAPPVWASSLAQGPLFHGPEPATLAPARQLAGMLRDRCFQAEYSGTGLEVEWHLNGADFAAGKDTELRNAARLAADGAPLAFAFDRPKRPVLLGRGLDRDRPACLLVVGVHLPRLLDQSGLAQLPDRFLDKLASLVRLAASAGVQKREFLREHGRDQPALNAGFLLNRAHVVVVPVGLDAVVRQYFGHGLAEGGEGLSFACQAIERIKAVLDEESAWSKLEGVVDSAAGWLMPRSETDAMPSPERERRVGRLSPSASGGVAGLTGWDADIPPKRQIETAALLHSRAGRGASALLIPREQRLSADDLVRLLAFAWRHTELARLRLVRVQPPDQPLLPPCES